MPIVKPIYQQNGKVELDMRVSPLTGQELYEEIVKSVWATQRPIMLTLPDVLRVTQRQFASLNSYTKKMLETEDRYMVTPHNAMDIVIDRDYQQVQEIEQTMQLTDDILSQRNQENTDGQQRLQQ